MLQALSDHLTDLKILLAIARIERMYVRRGRVAHIKSIASAIESLLKLLLDPTFETQTDLCPQRGVRRDPRRNMLSSSPHGARHRRSKPRNNRPHPPNKQRAQP